MSLQTTLARGEVRHWERVWKEHQDGCVGCSGSLIRQPCDQGLEIKGGLAAARRTLKTEREADKAPIPGQEMLL